MVQRLRCQKGHCEKGSRQQ
uniref:Uncharacterized protein n=1 Tax=Arundo donax TaxID=35708 RepID=A0A0A9A9Z7_ARUDO